MRVVFQFISGGKEPLIHAPFGARSAQIGETSSAQISGSYSVVKAVEED